MDDASLRDSLERPEAGSQPLRSLESRAYQIEMFEQSMQGNIIVTMDTGSGKTQIARLRIEAELERSPQKRVWFCTPNVVLAQQQHSFLISQLPSYQLRLITGHDNLHFWTTQEIWNTVLDQVDIVVSTPQVLLDALCHGFVSMHEISLLVFDEAHHCIANSPMALIMHRFYHPLKTSSETSSKPHILGLTASPITNKASKLHELERTMDSVCKTPTLQILDYERHVYLPTLEKITYQISGAAPSTLLRAVENLVAGLSLHDDPTVHWLQTRENRSLDMEQKLEKILTSGKTPVLRQMGSFLGHAQHICDNVGTWPADLFILTCASKLHESIVRNEALITTLADREQQYMDSKLQCLLSTIRRGGDLVSVELQIAPKAQAVIDYLVRQYRPGITVIIFVKRRSVAFALSQLLANSAQMKDYQVFSFVGAANPTRRNLFELAELQLQNEAFADFQRGKRNVCIATQVMEEGIDVQATNLVIRFDEPENFRSFVQSRGRARRPDSKFVIVQPMEDDERLSKINSWRELELSMRQQYSDLNRTASEQEEIENENEDGNEFYRVVSTGALLSYDNARQHLENFCATLPPTDDSQPAQPTMIISGDPLGPKSASVILPTSVPSVLQVTSSLRTWRTERMAKKDAAFQTYKKLHTSKLINDNLLPFPRVRKENDKLESRDSTYEVQEALSPWKWMSDIFPESLFNQRHRIRASGSNGAYPDMILYLPIRLDISLSFLLHSTTLGSILVEIQPEGGSGSIEDSLPFEVTSFLFATVLGRRLKRMNGIDRPPYFLLPDVASDLASWFERARTTSPLSEIVFNYSPEHEPCLLRHAGREIPYIWRPTFDDEPTKRYSPDESIVAERLSKQLSFLHSGDHDPGSKELVKPDVRVLPVGDCEVQGLSPGYGSFMLLMPSILHMLEIAIRGQIAVKRGPLNRIGFSNSYLVSKALTSSSASPTHNFESLEFVGDSLLKYYASVHVFFAYPELTEGGLTAKYAKMVNNARLQRATKDLGLDAYITLNQFSGAKWTLAMVEKPDSKRMVSSKTLADVVEALIGAAYLDPQSESNKDELPTAALSTLFPDIDWKLPSHHVIHFNFNQIHPRTQIARLANVEGVLSYEFRNKSLLLEALTRTSLRIGTQSFQRLEFLGDAILDRIVNVVLYESGFGLDPEHLKYRRDALVNRWLLGFLAMNAHHTVVTNDIEITSTGQTTMRQNAKIVRLIDHMRTSADRTEQYQRQKAEATFLSAHDQIASSLTSGTTFPWTALHSIDMSKSYSDMFEALIAAVFIDSDGDLCVCERLLDALGLFPILRRLATEPGLDVRQPIVMLRQMHPEIVVEERDKGTLKEDNRRWSCRMVLSSGEAIGSAESIVSQKHAEACAAELALEHLMKSGCAVEVEVQHEDKGVENGDDDAMNVD